jgi:hypothetical protein
MQISDSKINPLTFRGFKPYVSLQCAACCAYTCWCHSSPPITAKLMCFAAQCITENKCSHVEVLGACVALDCDVPVLCRVVMWLLHNSVIFSQYQFCGHHCRQGSTCIDRECGNPQRCLLERSTQFISAPARSQGSDASARHAAERIGIDDL